MTVFEIRQWIGSHIDAGALLASIVILTAIAVVGIMLDSDDVEN